MELLDETRFLENGNLFMEKAEIAKTTIIMRSRNKKIFVHSDVYNDENDEVFHYGYCDWYGPSGASGRSPFGA